MIPVEYDASNFANFADASAEGRALFLYYVAHPPQGQEYLGERLYACFLSPNGTCLPVKDQWSGTSSDGASMRSFELSGGAGSTPNAVLSLENSALMRMPFTSMSVQYSDSPSDMVEVPFSYDGLNDLQATSDHPTFSEQNTQLGGRFLQLVSIYMWDKATANEMSYFPFAIEEGKRLQEHVIDALEMELKTTPETRDRILHQMVVKYGHKYFREQEVLNAGGIGNVSDVIMHSDIGDMFFHFTVTLTTHLSNRTKDASEKLHILSVPVAFRLVA
jgi:hypothetical protein